MPEIEREYLVSSTAAAAAKLPVVSDSETP